VSAALDPGRYVGRAPQQVEEFIAEVVTPVRRQYPHLLNQSDQLAV